MKKTTANYSIWGEVKLTLTFTIQGPVLGEHS